MVFGRQLIMLLAIFGCATQAMAESLEARLIRATGTEVAASEKLQDILPKLKQQFGYPHYELMSVTDTPLTEGKRHRLDLGDGFVLFSKLESQADKKHKIEIEWYTGKVSIVKATVEIKSQGTLLIKGPEVGKDWIVLALTVREPAPPPSR
jgi:hypothetical protein